MYGSSRRPSLWHSSRFPAGFVCVTYKACAATVHCFAWRADHRAQINQKAELIIGVGLLQSHLHGVFSFFHKELASHLPHVHALYPTVYSMLGKSLIVTLTLVRSGKMTFSESLMPAVYGFPNRRRMPFAHLFRASIMMFNLLSAPFLNMTTL